MARWLKLTDSCFYQRVDYQKDSELSFQDINTIAMQKLGAKRKGIRPVAVKFSFYQPQHFEEDYTVEETCLVIVPKRSGTTIQVSTNTEGVFKLVPGADYYNRVLAIKGGTIMRMKTTRSDASFNNLIFMYNEDFTRKRATRDDSTT